MFVVKLAITNRPVRFNSTLNCQLTPIDTGINTGVFDAGFCVAAIIIGLANWLGHGMKNCCGYNIM